jgi:hypothetical protein
MQYDRNGVFVRQSQPNATVRTQKKVLHVDSADRDTLLYYTNGEFVVYLPRQYTNVVSLRLKSATFPPMSKGYAHPYTNGPNIRTATYGESQLSFPAYPYFMIEIDGLNRCDETAVGANKSQFPDSFFAKISNTISLQSAAQDPADDTQYAIIYDDHAHDENITQFTPPIARLDRLRIRTRLHSQQGSQGFFYWNAGQTADQGISTDAQANYSLTFEIEYLDNGFDSASSFETQLTAGRGY